MIGSRRSWRLAAAILAGALLFAACSSKADSPSVELKEFSVSVSPSSADSGETTFSVKNVGGTTHEFVVVKTDLDDGALPTLKDGSVDEEGGAGIEAVDEIEDIAAGDSGELTVDLEPGKYVLFCNVVQGDVSHYAKGMHTSFTVK